MVLYVDIETYSSVDLKKAGVYRYAESPDFEILMMAWAYNDEPVEVALGHEEIREVLDDPRWAQSLSVAHNAQFERICLSAFDRLPVGTYLAPDDWDDTAALAAEHGFPRSLSALAKALGVEEKDEAGTLLINWFCKPDRTGRQRLGEDHPEKWARFIEYCRQDVATLRAVHQALPDWPPNERAIYLTDQRINDRGIAIDREMAAAAVAADEAGRAEASEEMRELLEIENAGSVPQIVKALGSLGLHLPDLRKDRLEALLRGDDLTPVQRRGVELRLLTSLVAARKYQAALNACSSDGRLRGQFRFFGAHTGRWSSRGVQIHNLPNVHLDQIEEQVLDLMLGHNPGPKVLKALLRSLFVGPFTVLDYSSIEARGLAWVAGEKWVLEAFAQDRDIYVETAKRMSTADRPLTRQQGKVAVLALGYQGGVNSLRTMGADGNDDELQDLVYKYRAANPKIKALWGSMENAFIHGGRVGRLLVTRKGTDRHLVLPSGRSLVYHGVVVAGQGRDRRILFDDPKGFKTDTYGGRLVENAVQAICRDILAEALLGLEAAGLVVVSHVHDEAILEGTHPVDAVARVICRLPRWAGEFPIDAKGFQCDRYRKG